MTPDEATRMVEQRTYVRIYSGAIGCENLLMDEGWVVWYQEAPTIGIEHADGSQAAWSIRLPITEVVSEAADKAVTR